MIEIIKHSRQIDRDQFPVLASMAKCQEELGEFSEATLVQLGYLKYKTLKEDSFGEAADVMICVLDTLAAQYPELSSERIMEIFEERVSQKIKKWKLVSYTL